MSQETETCDCLYCTAHNPDRLWAVLDEARAKFMAEMYLSMIPSIRFDDSVCKGLRLLYRDGELRRRS